MSEKTAIAAVEAAGLTFQVTRHGRVGSLEEAAAARGVAPSDLIKTLVVRRAEGDYLFVLVPGGREISWPKLRELLGVSRLSMPDAETAREATGYERGTITPLGAEGDLLDANGNPPATRRILVIDSVAAAAGGAGGVSSNTSFVESAAGVADGARTGLASIVTGVCFLLTTFLAPLAEAVPYEAATPALVVVGFLMMQQVVDIPWKNLSLAVPAFLTIIFMPFSYSIAVGIGVGVIAYAVLMAATGQLRKVHPLMWGVSVAFLVYFAIGPIQDALGI